MKTLIAGFICLTFISVTEWQPDFATAQKKAKEKHRCILLNFSGSDWCIPCIRMKKEIFDDHDFLEMADDKLVLYNADFPRKKKNALEKTLKGQNEKLADKYNPEGKFPLTLLIDENGRIIKTWDGFPNQTPEQFIKTIKKLSDEGKN